MTITLLSLIMGLMLLAIPLVLLRAMQVPLQQKLLLSVGRAVLMLTALGGCLYLVYHLSSWVADVLAILLMTLLGTLAVVGKARLGRAMLVPIGVGLLVALLVVGTCLLTALGGGHLLAARGLIPVAGLLVGSMAETLSRALSTYYRSLLLHDRLYYYMIGNGKSPAEALSWYVRRTLDATVWPHARRLSAVVLTASPLVVWVLLLAGASVAEAVAVQILVLVAGLAASVVAVVTALYVARRYSFDAYGRLKG